MVCVLSMMFNQELGQQNPVNHQVCVYWSADVASVLSQCSLPALMISVQYAIPVGPLVRGGYCMYKSI